MGSRRRWAGMVLTVLLGFGLFLPQIGLGKEEAVKEAFKTDDIEITPLKEGIHFRITLPVGGEWVQANLEYWNGRIFEEGEKIRTNRSYNLTGDQKVLEFDLKGDPRIELNKDYLNFIVYFRLRLKDRQGKLTDSPEMVYYVRRVWFIQPAGAITFFAQRKNVYWDRLPQIANTITKSVDDTYGLKQKKVFVLLYKNGYSMGSDTGMPGWAAALFMWNIWIRDYNTETRFVAELAHEYTHYIQFENESRMPLFFMEGMSDYIYYQHAPEERPDRSLYRTLIAEEKYLDANQMYAGYPEKSEYIHSFYRQGYLFVNYIAEKLGPEKFKKFIHALSEKALDQVIAETPEFSKKRVVGMWMEIKDQVMSAKPRSLFKVKDKDYPKPVQIVQADLKDIWGLSFSTDSKKVAIGRLIKDKKDQIKSKTLEIMDVETGKVEKARDIRFERFSGVRWNPGDSSLFLTFVPQQDGDKIGVFSWKDAKLKILGGKNYNIDDARWSPDGRQIAFISDHSGAFELYTMDANGENERQLTLGIGYISSMNWLENGEGFLVVANRGGHDHIYRLRAPEFKPEELSCGDHYRIMAPIASPDGQRIAFFAYGADFYRSDLFVMDLARNQLMRVTEGANVSFVRWIDGGKNLLFGFQNDQSMDILKYPLAAAN